MSQERNRPGEKRPPQARGSRSARTPSGDRGAPGNGRQAGGDRDRPLIEQHFYGTPQPAEVRSSFLRRRPVVVLVVGLVAGLWVAHGCSGPSAPAPSPPPIVPTTTTNSTNPLPPVTHKPVDVSLSGQVTLQEGNDLTNIDLINVSPKQTEAAYVTLQVTRHGKPQLLTAVGDCSSANPTRTLVCPVDKVLYGGNDWAMTLSYKAGAGRARIQIRANGGAPNRSPALYCTNKGCSLG